MPGLVLIVGRNGAGKTNLLEAIHLGTQGFSPRTRSDLEAIRFGENVARVAVRGEAGAKPVDVQVTLDAQAGKRAQLNGVRLRAAEQLRTEVAALVFTPDRLSVIKGGPSVRRAYFDRALGRVLVPRSALSSEYGAAVAQRNAALRRVAGGVSSAATIEPWTERVVALGRELVLARRALVSLLAEPFRERAGELGLEVAALRYSAEVPTLDTLASRLARDIERGVTGAGPHLDDFAIVAGERDLRSFGSQGEQRAAFLGLLLAEMEVLQEQRGTAPLLLLDDVLSELDGERRRSLAERIRGGGGQALVTSTAAEALPIEASEVVEVLPGAARRAA